MPAIDQSLQVHERIVCSISAAAKYGIPANILLAIAEKENGKPGQWMRNANGRMLSDHFSSTRDISSNWGASALAPWAARPCNAYNCAVTAFVVAGRARQCKWAATSIKAAEAAAALFKMPFD